ncbi:MAG: hypothetical protein HKN20_06000 [Gemmatimonadetes bacterium]|nr:hypothetical protein [Gemmatimonadota bacterium]
MQLLPRFPFRSMKRFPIAVLLGTALAFSCGGGSDDPAGPGDGNGDGNGNGGSNVIGATVGGESFGASSTLSSASYVQAGLYVISGASVSKRSGVISFSMMNIPGPGTYPLGTGASVSGGTVVYADGGDAWGTPLSGRAGTITFSTLTADRIAGTFDFVGEAIAGDATGDLVVSDGSFDLPLDPGGPVGGVPERNRNVVTLTIDGEPYAASTVGSAGAPPGIFSVSSSSTEFTMTLSTNGISGPGTFDLATQPGPVSISISDPRLEDTISWGALNGGATGSIVVTSLTEKRIQGTISATLPVTFGPGTDPITITDGFFDIGYAN